MKKIYYLCYFDIPEHAAQKRNFVLSAATKSDYIAKSFVKAGYTVEIVSAAGTCGKNFCSGSVTQLGENLTLRLFDAKPAGNAVQRVFARRFLQKQLKSYLLTNVTGDDILLVYHSLGYMDLVKALRSKINCKICLDVEEIYGDVIGDEKAKEKELAFFQCADSYLFPTELLSQKVNLNGKPEAVIYGTYHISKKMPKLFTDDKIHCVYAGTLDPRKGGAAAVEAALFLNGDYHIHILGFGNEKEKAEMLNIIDDISKKTEAKITYDGLLSGDEFTSFIQSCDIGFSTQSPDAAFNSTSFPSKILTYMVNGLRVVSIRIPAIEKSAVGKFMYYYDEQTPEDIAKAIKSIDFSEEYDSRKTIGVLDKAFICDLKTMLKGLE